MFSVPSDSLSLVVAGSKTDECAVSSLSFRTGETANFVIGTEEGHIYSGCRFDRAGVKAGLNNEVFGGDAGHAALISSVEFHPGGGAGEFSDLCLSCSVDWSIKVWRPKVRSLPFLLAGRLRFIRNICEGSHDSSRVKIDSFSDFDALAIDNVYYGRAVVPHKPISIQLRRRPGHHRDL